MKILKNNLKNPLNLRTQQDFPIKGVEFIDITPLILQKETLMEIIDKFVEEIKEKNIDYIVAPEARGFLLASSIAYQLGVGVVPVRKVGKLPPKIVISRFEASKEYGKEQLELPKLVNDTYENKKFYIIDDIYATGNTMTAIKNALIQLNGNVVGEGVIMNIKELNNNNTLFSLIDINEE